MRCRTHYDRTRPRPTPAPRPPVRQKPCERLDCRIVTDQRLCITHRRAQRRYSLSIERYLAIVNGSCGICGTDSRIQVDHDHACCPTKTRSCGRCVRGGLCWRCNVAAGWATGQNWAAVTAARAWVERHQLERT